VIIATLTEFLGRYLYIVGAGIGALALFYAALAVLATLLRPRARRAGGSLALVSILKPLCGNEARLYESLRSFCVLDYPRYQLVFGVADRKDPAVQVVETLRREFPHLEMTLVACGTRHGSNPKVSNLINMMPSARHEYLVIADSDISVAPDYLERLVPHLEDPSVGIVTCAYRGHPVNGLWSKVGAEFINGWFTPSVFVAALFGSREFAFGATIGLRRDVLESVGGFAAMADQLADDYRLGELTRRRGLRTVLSEVIVSTTVGERTLPDLIDHELRWLRTIRCLRPTGYGMAGISYSVPAATVGALLSLHWFAMPWLLAATLLCRVALIYAGPFTGRRSLRRIPVAMAADCVLFALWCGSFMSQRVRWRNARFDVSRDGSAVPVMLGAPQGGQATSYARGDARPVDQVISTGELS
jgi:ceramide glucosyltransferase